ncbi:MAG: DUF2092 domain-containing protein, partial [Rhodoplanes sp.]
MKKLNRRSWKFAAASGSAAALVIGLTMLPGARADPAEAEANAKNLFKAMSDYLAAQDTLSFAYDSTLEIVTDEEQKLALAGSGTVTLKRP